jgi:hypothetical protein
MKNKIFYTYKENENDFVLLQFEIVIEEEDENIHAYIKLKNKLNNETKIEYFPAREIKEAFRYYEKQKNFLVFITYSKHHFL